MKLLFTSIFFLTTQWVWGQETFLLPSYHEYGVNEGMPSSECYNTTQDNDGFIWVFTDRGVSRFNGYDFKTYTTANGLPNNVVFDGKCDKNGTLWVVTQGGLFAYFNGHRFLESVINESIKEIPFNLKIDQFYIDQDNVLWAFGSSGIKKAFLLIEFDINIEKLTLHREDNFQSFPLVIKRFNEQHSLSKHNPAAAKSFTGAPIEADGFDYLNGNELGQSNTDRNRVPLDLTRVIELNDHFKLVSYGHHLISVVNGHKSLQRFSNSILCFFKSNDTLLISILNEGVSLYTINDTTITFQQQWLPNYSITSVAKDRMRALWITTLNNGLIYMPNSRINSLSSPLSNKYISHIGSTGNKLIALANHSELHCFTPKLNQLKQQTFTINNYANCFAVLNKNVVVVPNNSYLLFTNVQLNTAEQIPHSSAFSYAAATKTGWMAARSGRFQEFNGSTSQSAFVVPNEIKPSCIFYDSLENLKLIGTYRGIYKIEKDSSISEWNKTMPFAKKRITDIVRIDDQTIAIGTLGDGIYFVKNELFDKHLNKGKGLQSNLVNDALMINENQLAIASNSGIEIIEIDMSGIAAVRYSTKNGLRNNQVNELCIWNKHLAAATAEGITLIELASIPKDRNAPHIFIDSLVVNDSTRHFSNKNHYSFNENGSGLEIHFTALDYEQNGQIQYAYKLLPNDKNWTLTENRNVKYAGLNYGDYKFQLSTINPYNGMVYGLNTLTIPFSVIRPFYLKTWFIVSVIIGVSILMVLLSLLYVRFIRIKAKTDEQLNAMEQQALKAQMNPHFLFNAMNSVQNFIATNDKKQAFSFISRFSTLIREFLDNSQKKQISLKNELDGLKAYLELEKLRFENKFDYDIYVADGIKNELHDIEIPGMIIQPLLENAIIHGVRPLHGQGHIKIDVLADSQSCIVSVSDNGIGRKASEELNASKANYHKSYGTANLERRIHLLNKFNNKKISFEIVDVEDGKHTGTIVILRFPINRHHYEN